MKIKIYINLSLSLKLEFMLSFNLTTAKLLARTMQESDILRSLEPPSPVMNPPTTVLVIT